MKCKKCYLDKLSDEFPFGTISSKCEHVSSWCLKCLVIYLKAARYECPICKVKLTEQEIINYCLIWDNASFKIDFESFSHTYTELPGKNSKSGTFYVDDDDENNTLTSYGICANSHIQLIVVLYSISKGQAVNNLVFDLYWGYRSKMDFLDGTCLIYKAKLENLPDDVTQLYLILSSWNSPTISHFVNPSFKLYDEAKPLKCLCKYNINKAGNSRAVIMCLINRSQRGNWNVFELGKLSRGNAKDYGPIKDNINRIIDLGYKAYSK
ncbi:14878_t:CDS:2 [Cetraspora pellucida]|uniref:14878_t:CDS:1 n=1 Tax=Cetraspora pellucida TaxID=1433469 RepID=A0ACA9M5A1_9GLOM|nr:14878_t:CDS:2 [Cetraspora pellucida]